MTKVFRVSTSQHDRFPSAISLEDRGRTRTATTMCSLPASPRQLSWFSGTMLRLKLALASAVVLLWSYESPMAWALKPPMVRLFFRMEAMLLLPLPELAMTCFLLPTAVLPCTHGSDDVCESWYRSPAFLIPSGFTRLSQ